MTEERIKELRNHVCAKQEADIIDECLDEIERLKREITSINIALDELHGALEFPDD